MGGIKSVGETTRGNLRLTIGPDYNTQQISGFYTRLLRDEVVAEWVNVGSSTYTLHVYCHVSGEERWLAPPLLRNYIFRREMPLVLDTLVYAERSLLLAQPELGRAQVFVHFQSSVKELDTVEYWGVLGDRSTWPRGPTSILLRMIYAVVGWPPSMAAQPADLSIDLPAEPQDMETAVRLQQQQQHRQRQEQQQLLPLGQQTVAEARGAPEDEQQQEQGRLQLHELEAQQLDEQARRLEQQRRRQERDLQGASAATEVAVTVGRQGLVLQQVAADLELCPAADPALGPDGGAGLLINGSARATREGVPAVVYSSSNGNGCANGNGVSSPCDQGQSRTTASGVQVYSAYSNGYDGFDPISRRGSNGAPGVVVRGDLGSTVDSAASEWEGDASPASGAGRPARPLQAAPNGALPSGTATAVAAALPPSADASASAHGADAQRRPQSAIAAVAALAQQPAAVVSTRLVASSAGGANGDGDACSGDANCTCPCSRGGEAGMLGLVVAPDGEEPRASQLRAAGASSSAGVAQLERGAELVGARGAVHAS
ncbi:hypothetical protein GPECTOR_19g378 [Gonium pectorale]|uniref:Staygreen protein domain-containing protein n=1 Tax=Gonium pectorale TaxID=33097 RepID=A0A150GJE4_GONPE|nr:hypothetical protein GPECTOR_19g378 [Gonium pectorale]|eukprot:KXZ49927.1 hypothetical protein GPECTOR_19g378 [Gonium pectorale]